MSRPNGPSASGSPHTAAHPSVDRTGRVSDAGPREQEEEALRLPHERDQSTDQTAEAPDPRIRQASRDLENGQVDTDMRAPSGLDAQKRRQYVQGAGGRHPSDSDRREVAHGERSDSDSR